jgi:excisionase family DNA binding protein
MNIENWLQSHKKDLLTTSEVSELLGVKPQTLQIWRTNKRYNLPYVKIGGLVRYKLDDIKNFIEQRTVRVEEV